MAAPQVGTVSVRVNGDVLRLRGNVTYSLGGLVREAVEGPLGLAAFKVSGMAPFVEVETVDAADVDLAALQDLSGVTVTLQLRNSKTIVLNDASVVGQLEVSSEDGGFSIRFVGSSAKEI